ncbi:FCD domain-containing protein [Nocardioides sambongensis]|uniref:FCD domain-containing protein n=1 Tax=Nocardioides sambongensis TaxID=2589074 RepID=UPI001E654C7D|nr:FCD domain-containing protein [Nocardioides sambongensis]
MRHQGNAVIAEIYDGLQPRQVRLGTRTLSERPSRLHTIEAEHRDLLRALEASDAAECVAVLGRHLREVPELVDAFGEPRTAAAT